MCKNFDFQNVQTSYYNFDGTLMQIWKPLYIFSFI